MLQLSKYVIAQQCEVLAALLKESGSLRLYEGAQPDISTRTEGRLVECAITSVTIANGQLTISWDAGTAIKAGQADYYRLCSKNIPVMSGSIPTEMEMSDRSIVVGTIVDAGQLIHTVFK